MTSSSSNTSQKLSTRGASSMAELMAKFGKEIHALKKGQEVKGIVTSIKSSEIMMRVDNKTDALIVEKDKKLLRQLLSLVTVGEEVVATVLYPESDSGYPVVSIRHFMEGKMWEYLEKLQKGSQKLSATVLEVTKGGLVVEIENGIQGFLPNSHMTKTGSADELLGQKLQVSIVELNKENRKVVFSQKGAFSAEDLQKLAQQYKAGTKIRGKVSGITPFGLFVSLPYTNSSGEETSIDGLVHISEVAWEKVDNLLEQFTVGEEVDAVVIGTDTRSKRIDLSIKRLSKDPFQSIIDAFPIDKKITGTAKEMVEEGLLVDLGDVDGVRVVGLMKKDKIPPTTTYAPGDKVTATVVAVDVRKRKVMLTPVLLEKPLMYR